MYDYLKDQFRNFAGKTFRTHQEDAIQFAIESDKPIVVIKAPTGSGKSLIGSCIAATTQKSTYLVHSKQLQTQLNIDFPEFELMQGRNNFKCLQNGFPADKCIHSINGFKCSHKAAAFGRNELQPCPYEKRKIEVAAAPWQLLNYPYFLFEANYVGKFSDRELIICDEGDLVEGLLLDFVQLQIPFGILKKLKIGLPKYKTTKAENGIESWKQWAEWSLGPISRALNSAEDLSEKRRYQSLMTRMTILKDNVDHTWIMQEDDNRVTFKPIWMSKQLSQEFFFKHAPKFVFMSATFPPAEIMGQLLGRDPGDFDYFEVPSNFPVSHRQVMVRSEVQLNKESMETDLARNKVCEQVVDILADHVDEKGIIHTHSYQIAGWIMDLGLDRLITHDSSDREEVLEHFKKSEDRLVLVSPSMERGVDLPYDDCRFAIIVKCPFPYLGDKFISSRAYSGSIGNLWYKSITAQDIVQACGRGVRHADDWCATYCLDGKIQRLIIDNRRLFPEYFLEAVEIV